ncbi:histone deacetylase [Kluyveromyces lactis]|uniref:KLLA0F00858p n=1 Tax=Kluyveromyces lactis (strain ATCC 8585 / CBS 2359 / DSM 70799 / NBRC 1267 / NRRL Y-1140 / WM37) TaxID=284590 RepID=Q6CLS1_KLULA|nr:uncharacterized protein KLLA0_F00858g [Kluyveromyces lactis]CAG97825.1 KLLA0F00858p [Kluyveromyces lactis]|eukprot:XP_455118.1 uncharacterized protein KLLA0_F00858g [Kluyveromyces lactis]
MSQDPLHNFKVQFEKFVASNPNVSSVTSSASRIPESSKAVIVLSPYSLSHQFPRYWVSKSYKKTIVERPERLLACCIGVSAAITMYPALFSVKTSNHHKTSLLAPHVLKVHGKDWPRELLKLCKESEKKIDNEEVEVPPDWNVGDIYLSKHTIAALEGSIGALEIGVDSIFQGVSVEQTANRAFIAIRPPGHHSHASTPSGFCLLNNAHIAIEYAFEKYDVTHAVILDFDLHHGDGTQDICWKRAGFRPDEFSTDAEHGASEDDNKYDEFGKSFAEFPKVGYFSLHDINSFPTELGYATKENIRNASTCIMDAHDINIWNVHLQSYKDEEEFVKLYQTKYRSIFAKADEFFKNAKLEMKQGGFRFKGLVVISAGFDASEYEQQSMQRHNVNVPTSFYNLFTKDALKLAQMHSNGKIISVMEGGYSDGAIASGVFSHLIGFQNQNWISEWGSEQVVKEIIRGCKPRWKPYKTKKARDVIRIWAEEVIMLGRSMIPEFEKVLFDTEDTVTHPEVRLTRSKYHETIVKHENEIPRTETPTPVRREKPSEQPKDENVPFVDQILPSDEENEEDEDYIYDEELNKTFNRTVEDITIDDISRHLETLDIIQAKEDEEEQEQEHHGDNGQSHRARTRVPVNSHQRNSRNVSESSNSSSTQETGSNVGGYKIPSNTTTRHLRSNRHSRLLNFDDSDISMISHGSPPRPKTRSSSSKNGGSNRW